MSKFISHFLFSCVRLVLYDFDLQADPPIQDARLATRFDVFNAASSDKHTDLLPLYPSRILKQRFGQGEECYVAYVNEKVVAYGWVSYGEAEIGEINKLMVLKPQEAYLYDFFTQPDYRGQNLYPALLSRIITALRDRNFRCALIFVLYENAASRRGVGKAGFRQFQIVTYLKILGLRFYIDRQGFFGS